MNPIVDKIYPLPQPFRFVESNKIIPLESAINKILELYPPILPGTSELHAAFQTHLEKLGYSQNNAYYALQSRMQMEEVITFMNEIYFHLKVFTDVNFVETKAHFTDKKYDEDVIIHAIKIWYWERKHKQRTKRIELMLQREKSWREWGRTQEKQN